MVVELCEEGSVHDILTQQPKPAGLGEHARLALKLAQDTAKGMCYLHGRNPPVVHLDLKSPNVLVTEGFVAKVRKKTRKKTSEMDENGGLMK
jgi:serine/threonine protein kinase